MATPYTITVIYNANQSVPYKYTFNPVPPTDADGNPIVRPGDSLTWVPGTGVSKLVLFFLDKGPTKFGPAGEKSPAYAANVQHVIVKRAATQFEYLTIIDDADGNLAPPDDPIIVLDQSGIMLRHEAAVPEAPVINLFFGDAAGKSYFLSPEEPE